MPANSTILRNIAQSKLNPKVAYDTVSAKGMLKNSVASVVTTLVDEVKEVVSTVNEKIDVTQLELTTFVNEVIEVIEQKVETIVETQPEQLDVEKTIVVETENNTRKRRNAVKKTDYNDS